MRVRLIYALNYYLLTYLVTVVRRRHRSDDRRGGSVTIDLLTDPDFELVVPDAAGTVPGALDDWKSTSVDEHRRESGSLSTSSGSADDSSQRTVDSVRLPDVARRGRMFAKRYRRRLVLPSGVCNVSFANVDRRGVRLVMDIFTTLLEMKWRYTRIQAHREGGGAAAAPHQGPGFSGGP